MVGLHCPTPIPIPIPMKSTKATLAMMPMVISLISIVALHWKSVTKTPYWYRYWCQIEYSTICIGIGITIRIGAGSVQTVLHIIIEPNFIGIGVGISRAMLTHHYFDTSARLIIFSI